jgi:ubiquinol-cytochrome c reductase cytochrome c1 subunit
MAKDVVSFLAWCSMPEHDERKKQGVKTVVALSVLAVILGVAKRRYWSIHKTRRITYAPTHH